MSENINDILALHFSGEKLSPEQELRLAEWIADHKDEYRRLSQLDGAFPFSLVPHTHAAWNRTASRMGMLSLPPVPRLIRYASYAACLLLGLGFSILLGRWGQESPVSFSNAGQQNMMVALPDSSTVMLYPKSRLDYTLAYKGSQRKVRLAGKAFFRVKPCQEKPFVVESGKVRVKVLGTSFLVADTLHAGTAVFVREGKVEVAAGNRKVVLQKHQQVLAVDTRLQTAQINNPTDFFGPMAVSRTYESTPLQQVLADLEEEFRVRFTIRPQYLSCKVTTVLQLNDLEEVLDELAYICNFRYEKVNDKKYSIH